MSNNKQAHTLTLLIIIFPLISLLVYGSSSYLFIFFTKKQENEKALKNYEQTLVDIEKERLKEKIHGLSQFINYYDSRSSDKIKEDVKNIVNVTVNVANNIYDSYKNTKTEQEIKQLIRLALKEIKFEGDIGYLFMLNLDGYVILHIDKKMQDRNILEIQDIYGKYIIKEFNKVLLEDGEGYVDYYWYIKSRNKQKMHYKISYVKMLACYDWYVGAGEYLKFMTKFVKEDIIKYISSLSNFHNGHFFVFTGEGNIVYYPSNTKEKDLTPYKREGFFLTENRLSYSSYIKEYDWYIVATSDLKDIQQQILLNKKLSTKKQSYDMQTNFYLLFISWFISILLSLYLSKIISNLLKNYEKQLYDSNERLIFQSRQAIIGELFSMIAHQWRQPVNKVASILVSLRYGIQNEKLTLKEIDNKCVEIEDSIEFISETVDDFRNFYKPRSDYERVNLKTLIIKSLFFLESSLEKKSILLDKDLENINYKTSQNEFVQIILNLVKNAIDAVDDKGHIAIRLYQDDVYVYIDIQNDCITLENNHLIKIFDPYFTTKDDSSGLGLYMVRSILEKHMKGKITVQQKNDMINFLIFLPK